MWSTTNDVRAVIDPNAAGSIDTGVASLTPDGVCVFDSIFQTFTMPPRDRSEIFAVDVSYFTDSVNFSSIVPLVLIDGGWNTLPGERFDFTNNTFCLGERGYGGDVEFRIGSADDSTCEGTPTSSLRFDRFAVRRALAGECPDDVGETINGDMEANNGWTFAFSSGGTADYADNIGAGNSRGIRITRSTTASSASATSRISLPMDTSVPSSAIEFFSAGTASGVFEVRLGGQPVSRMTPTGVRRVCVPEWAKGTVQDITFALTLVMSSGAPINRSETIDLDAVSVVSDAGCGADATLYDNDFETFFDSPGLAPGWAVTIGGVNGTEAPATILNDPSSAHSGNGSLRLTATNVCNRATARRDIFVPESNGAAGPAITAFVNIPSAPIGEGGLRFFAQSGETVNAPEGVGYQQVIMCIPPKYIGRRLTIEAFADGGGGGCSDIAGEDTFIDDLEVTTDPTCPN
ncbi:MAG: hypothetical protein HKN80_01880 [Acidimicrobiia bacterium]|nr:hypothetical protein [Acidimicrobiia bacterium]